MLYNCNSHISELNQNLKLWLLPFGLILLVTSKASVSAQVIPDNTLPQNSVVTPNGSLVEITGGTIKDTNLFHSFEQFSVLNGQTAFFDNAANIANIISRVTGSSISEIDGLIKANGRANLFLINPNGMIFGENAALDLGGSFIGSTADSLKFTDGREFSAVNPDAATLLTVSIPVGLQYGGDQGDITVQGSGNNLFIDFDTFTVDRSERPEGLAVKPEKTLALVGGNVFVEGGNLTAPEGNIELGSVAGNGTVKLTPNTLGWKLGYENVDNFQDINLSQAASLEASGNSGGRVRVKGDFVSVTDGSAILTDTRGDGVSGSLTIEASETEIYGVADNGFTSSTFTNVDLGATGDGGDALINTGYLYVGDGAQVNVNTFGLGNAGTLTVKADEIEILGGSVDGQFPSGLFAQADVGQTGRGGDINIEADYFLVADGAQVSVNTFGDGDAGKLTVKANEIELIAGSRDFGSSGLFASADSGSTGNGGSLNIEADSLYIADGARAIAATFGAGNAGKLTVKANEIELVGASPGGTSSGLFSTVEEAALGNGGNLQIDTSNLLITDGAQIAVSTAGEGNAGILDLEADNIELIGASDFGASGLFSSAIIDSGNGGEINLTSDRLSLTDGATISASNFASRNSDIPPGQGSPGKIDINVNSLKLDSTIPNEFTTITTAANAQTGGNITLNVDGDLALNNYSQIISETKGQGDAGSINILATELNLNNQGQVSTNSTGLGQAGNIAIASDSLNLNEGRITATSTQTGGGEIKLVTDSIFLDHNSLISTSVLDSTGGGGNIFIDNSNFIIGRNNSDIKADAVLGQGGNIQINSTCIFLDADSQITASSKFGVDGVVEINNTESNKKLSTVQLPNIISTPEAVIVSSCPIPETNTFVVAGKGGIPENPEQYLKGQTIWQDFRQLANNVPDFDNNQPQSTNLNSKQSSSVQTIVESQGWIINHQGNIELIAATPQITPQTFWQPTVKCGDF
jgi:filamentous hemagglutinin family protein